MALKRTIVYVDGYNMYHAIDDLNDDSLKWLNLYQLSQDLLRDDEELKQVIYFSAFATHYREAYERHRTYVGALRETGVKVIMGKFKKKYPRCKICHANYMTHEEKETDVNIAIHLIRDVLQDSFDRAIIISADTDMNSAVTMARGLSGTKCIDIVAPPGRKKFARSMIPILEITKGRLKRARLKERYDLSDGKVLQTPIKYRLPS